MKVAHQTIFGIVVISVVIAGIVGAFTMEPGRSARASSAAQAATATPFPACTPTPGPGTPTATPDVQIVPGHYLILVDGQAGDPSIYQLVSDIAQQYAIQVIDIFEWAPSFAGTVPPQKLAALQSDPRVVSVVQTTIRPIVTDYPPCLLPTSTPTPGA